MAYTDTEQPPPREADKSKSQSPATICGCFRLSCFGSRRPSWWARGVGVLLKLREWSEIVAGPRWKTFIRRFNRNRSGGGGAARAGKFQYDPLSYAMNFDEGSRQIGELDDDIDDFSALRNFSARYASIPAPLKTGGTGDFSTVA